ncbi:hypothetical protein FE633_21220 [Streptomyces montanus]|uniref:DUF5134 domain-containing protein n=1 Tax=Streptomyces montanus TaxID=2580423 RepID=A0A5R9FK80_9ACTN|nr:hypothetical protein [Streptomyces montanus]TLS44287.1 hypothetical protein FE633_21220 [Streptomyces montanus]
MHELLAVAGLAAAAVCLAGHLPGPARGWGPHAVAMAVMAMMVIPGGRSREALLIGAAAVASACVWRVCAGCPGRGRSAETADLAAMALLTAATEPMGTAMEHHSAGAGTGGLALFVVACWAVTRAGGIMVAQLRGADGAVARQQDAGALVMVATMTVMAF